jgi:hypothetical protein
MAKITFIVENDAGEILDQAEAIMSQQALEWSIEAVCDAHAYGPESEVSKARYFSWMIRKWVEKQVERYATKLATEAALAQAAALKDTVVVPTSEG